MKAVIFFSTETVKGFFGGFSNFFVCLSYEEMMRENSIQVRNPYLSTGECRYLTLVLWVGEKGRNVTTSWRSVQFFFSSMPASLDFLHGDLTKRGKVGHATRHTVNSEGYKDRAEFPRTLLLWATGGPNVSAEQGVSIAW